jgi:hypothetical protein
MRRHFLRRDTEKASGVVEQWKHEDIYPYAGEPKDIIEETERQIFGVVAVNLDGYCRGLQGIQAAQQEADVHPAALCAGKQSVLAQFHPGAGRGASQGEAARRLRCCTCVSRPMA